MSKNGILNGAESLWKRPRGNRFKGPKNGGKIAENQRVLPLTIHDINGTTDYGTMGLWDLQKGRRQKSEG